MKMKSLLIAVGATCVMGTQVTVWGGDHIEIETTASGARVEFDCAHGTIDAPLEADARGAFRLGGTFTPERAGPGPSRDEGPRPLKATYSGTINDGAMNLRIDIEGQDQARAFTLTRGQRGQIRKCK
jgi:hypothetical protein